MVLLVSSGCDRSSNPIDEKDILDPRAILLADSAGNIMTSYPDENMEDAIDLFNQAIVIQPDYYEAHLYKEVCLSRLGRKEEAFEALKARAALRPRTPHMTTAIGAYYDLHGDTAAAKAQYLAAEFYYSELQKPYTGEVYAGLSRSGAYTDRALNLKLLGEEKKANELLEKIRDNHIHISIQAQIDAYLKMTREEYLEYQYGD